jgi:hypothetical protein
MKGDASAASSPPSETAPESAVRLQPNSRVSGSTKMESVATAEPWRANPTAQSAPRMTQP